MKKDNMIIGGTPVGNHCSRGYTMCHMIYFCLFHFTIKNQWVLKTVSFQVKCPIVVCKMSKVSRIIWMATKRKYHAGTPPRTSQHYKSVHDVILEKFYPLRQCFPTYFVRGKALHSKLLTKLSSHFSSRNEFFAISEVRV